MQPEKIVTHIHYKCGFPGCDDYEKYRAIGNIPQYAHLCKKHWEQDPNRDLYAVVESQ